jgi:hypothetical protein
MLQVVDRLDQGKDDRIAFGTVGIDAVHDEGRRAQGTGPVWRHVR